MLRIWIWNIHTIFLKILPSLFREYSCNMLRIWIWNIHTIFLNILPNIPKEYSRNIFIIWILNIMNIFQEYIQNIVSFFWMVFCCYIFLYQEYNFWYTNNIFLLYSWNIIFGPISYVWYIPPKYQEYFLEYSWYIIYTRKISFK